MESTIAGESTFCLLEVPQLSSSVVAFDYSQMQNFTKIQNVFKSDMQNFRTKDWDLFFRPEICPFEL